MDSNDQEHIRSLIPFAQMPDDIFKSTIPFITLKKYAPSKIVFKRGDTDILVYWLMEGSVDLLDKNFEARSRKSKDENAKYVLDSHEPHRITAITTSNCRLALIPRSTLGEFSENLDAVISLNRTLEDDDGVDWMSALLSSPLFEFIPPANIQTLFSKFEEVEYAAGEVVIRQGEPGDYFYVIQSGRTKVERQIAGKAQLLVELKAGDNFGQDALVSDEPRNANVTMLTDGTLMRLAEPDFENLLMAPVIETVTLEEANEMIAAANPKTYILDVRNPKELKTGKLENSLNVPLLLLRKNMPKLITDAIYITTCNNGKRSKLAAYQLNESGFTGYVLEPNKDT
ncbi:MAG: cyclic nucleotide-binding domain-containing protein [Gammaproteobacteria bacterium]|nr:cyclic nucleotide-binding domain-containing protein [Gammaproteobacteria bacterium]